jgi:hypothetical protein
MTKRLREDDIPSEFICPITLQPMQDPVLIRDGHSYERSAIKKWFENHNTSPLTNKKLLSKHIFPNRALKALARRFYPSQQTIVLIPAKDEFTKHEATYHIFVEIDTQTVEFILQQLSALVKYETNEIRLTQDGKKLKPNQLLSSLRLERDPELTFALHPRLPWTMQIFVEDRATGSGATWTLNVAPHYTIKYVMLLLSWKTDSVLKNCGLTFNHRLLKRRVFSIL